MSSETAGKTRGVADRFGTASIRPIARPGSAAAGALPRHPDRPGKHDGGTSTCTVPLGSLTVLTHAKAEDNKPVRTRAVQARLAAAQAVYEIYRQNGLSE